MTSDITLTKGSTVVTLFTSSVDETFTKTLVTISPPQSRQNWTNGPKDSKIVDLLRIAHRFEIDGFIAATEGTYGQSDTSSTVAGKRTNLISIFNGGGTLTMEYSGTNYTVNIEKLSIKELPEDSATVTKLDLKMGLIVGVDI